MPRLGRADWRPPCATVHPMLAHRVNGHWQEQNLSRWCRSWAGHDSAIDRPAISHSGDRSQRPVVAARAVRRQTTTTQGQHIPDASNEVNVLSFCQVGMHESPSTAENRAIFSNRVQSALSDCNNDLQIVRLRDLYVARAQLCCTYAPAACMLFASSCGTAPIVDGRGTGQQTTSAR